VAFRSLGNPLRFYITDACLLQRLAYGGPYLKRSLALGCMLRWQVGRDGVQVRGEALLIAGPFLLLGLCPAFRLNCGVAGLGLLAVWAWGCIGWGVPSLPLSQRVISPVAERA